MSGSFQNVHVRVNDAKTGQPLPVRIAFYDSEGNYYAPLGRLSCFATAPGHDVGGNLELRGQKFAYIDGGCEVRLPVGAIDVCIAHGLEYLLLRQTVKLPQGKLALRFALDRWYEASRHGWHAGEIHAYHLSPHAALLEGETEGLRFVNVLTHVFRDAVGTVSLPNILSFSGQAAALENKRCTVAVNSRNRHRRLGELALLHCHRTVFPLEFGSPDEPDEWNLADLCEQCHRKRGLVVGLSLLQEFGDIGETPADLLLGLIDAVDIRDWFLGDDTALERWFAILDCGVRCPVVAGSGKADNQTLLGMPRTYARIENEGSFSQHAWIESVRDGRTFVTSGPMLAVDVGGKSPGGTLEIPAGATTSVRASVNSLAPFDEVSVLFNGEPICAERARKFDERYAAEVTCEWRPAGSGWLVVVCKGPRDELTGIRIGAITSPLYIRLEGRPFAPRRGAVVRYKEQLVRTRRWIEERGCFENDAQRRRMLSVYDAALQKAKELEGRT